MAKEQPKLLLFDVDGVILDSFEEVYQDVMRVIKKHGGQVLSQEQYRELFKGNALAHVLAAVGLRDTSEVPLDVLSELFVSYDKVDLFAGMKEVLEQLAETNVLVAVTSTLAGVIEKRFDDLGISALFAGYLGSEAGVNKRAKVNMAMDEFGPQTGEVVFITDTSGDLLEVKETGIRCIGVTWGYHDRGALELGIPDEIAETPEELLQILLS